MMIGLRVSESGQIGIYLSPIFETIIALREFVNGWTLGT